MARSVKYVLLFLAFLSLSSFRFQQGQVEGWVYEREKKGIKIFTKKSKWGHLRDAKAMMWVNASPEQTLKVLTDFNNYSQWMPRCQKSRILARLSDHEYIVQMFFDAPWPVKDRDCVVRFKIDKNPTTGVITLTETSEPKYIREEADIVRIQQLVATWKLSPRDGGTDIMNEYSSNPGGNLPDWLVNTQSVESPMATFESLQERTSTQK